MKKISFIVLCVVTCFLGSCTNDNDEYRVNFNEAEFNQKYELWKTQNFQNYTFKFAYFASSGPFDINVIVENGVPSGDSDYSQAYTIDEVFDKIKNDYNEALNQNSSDLKQVSIEVTYNKEYHYPESIKYSTSYKGTQPDGGAFYDIRINDFIKVD